MYVSCTSVCFSIAKRGACIWRKGREHAKAYMHVPVNVCQNQFCWIISKIQKIFETKTDFLDFKPASIAAFNASTITERLQSQCMPAANSVL